MRVLTNYLAFFSPCTLEQWMHIIITAIFFAVPIHIKILKKSDS